jgi:ribonucleoside-diphosphate reductase beta chain
MTDQNATTLMDQDEPLLMDVEEKQYTFFPIPENQQGIFDYWELHKSTFWDVPEVKMDGDREDFQKLSAEEQHFLSMTLAFFASSDVIVADNISNYFMKDCKWSTVQLFYRFQMSMEDIHSQTYGLLIETLIRDPKKKAFLFDALHTIPCVKAKAGWVLNYMNHSIPFARRLMAFILFEGVAFASSFASIFFMREQHPGKMKGLVFSNEVISRDESLHCDFGIYLMNTFVKHKLTTEEAHEMVESLLVVERQFLTESLPTSLIGLSPASMVDYVEFTGDQILERMGYAPRYSHKLNPLAFMTAINIQHKTNFFEADPSSYAMSDVHAEQFAVTDDF